ncbi:hypothetical protein [Paenibacillus polymyxa]|uniref:hypothetical protein n=1 Tax=Paenibacillus polymyxa TaxID=1406 RepID=UPI002AB3D9D1|nr:hypothetical protein [Paenibacillus polymyxa]MDY8021147.1 hypothetical protein [Paenibacillus polymyxa]
MDKWKTEVMVDDIEYNVKMTRRYSPAVNEHLFEYEIFKDGELVNQNNVSIYSKKDVETWLRKELNCKGKRFSWCECK